MEKIRVSHLKSILLVIFFASTLIPLGFLYSEYSKKDIELKNLKSNPQDKNTKIMEDIGRLIKLPEGESPTIATVTDREKLSNQAFFTKAKNGDIVVIYGIAKKAILYDPVSKKIIDVAPLTIHDPTPTIDTSAATPTPEAITLILLNGTTVNGLTRNYENELKQKITNFEIIERNNAKKTDYDKTLLIDIGNDQTEKAQNLSTLLGISLNSLPIGETTSTSADFAIIVGTDKE